MNLEQLIKIRSTTRTLVTKCCVKCKALELENPLDIKKLSIASAELNRHQVKLTRADEQIMILLDVNDLEEEVERIEEYDNKISQAINSLNYEITAHDSDLLKTAGRVSKVSNMLHGEELFAKLPQLKISPFFGSPLKWQEFWDAFESMVHKRETLTPVVKFNYLISFLEGDARRAVEGIAITNTNYTEAIKILKERFGKEDVIIFAHLDRLFSLPISRDSTSKLRELYDECEKHIRCLNVFGNLTLDQIFVPLILSKLPQDIRILLHRKIGSNTWDLISLRKSFREEIEAREMGERRLGDISQSYDDKNLNVNVSHAQKSTTSSFMSQSQQRSSPGRKHNRFNRTYQCIFCSENHAAWKCPNYKSIETRKIQVRGRCLKCFRQDHETNDCEYARPCYQCHKTTHNSSLCPILFESSQEMKTSVVERKTHSNYCSSVRESVRQTAAGKALAQTAIVDVISPKFKATTQAAVRVLLDTGSQKSYITEDRANELNLVVKYYENLSISVFGANSEKSITCPVVDLKLMFNDGSSSIIDVSVVPVISSSVERIVLNSKEYPILKGLELADPGLDSLETQIDVLIGSDYYYQFVHEKRIQLAEDLVALDTSFGWMPAGCLRKNTTERKIQTLLALPSDFGCYDVKFTMEKFWNLESIGIRESATVSDDETALQKFRSSVLIKDHRYEVAWPWKDDHCDLPDNFHLSLGRLKSVVRQLSRKPEVLCRYDKIIKDQLQMKIIEKVDDIFKEKNNKIHYLPHHCVIRPEKNTTKIRIVYDASAKAGRDLPSLNECMYRGPIIMEDLAAILIRFRLHPIAVTCDIEKAFLQIGLRDNDRDVTRFLWLDDVQNKSLKNNLAVYRFCRVPFGIISSPFLLSATIAYHLEQSGSSLANDILKNTYVDNILTGANSVDGACELFSVLKLLMSEASMNLREWTSNSREFLERVPIHDHSVDDNEINILGMTWDTQNDELRIRGPKIDNKIMNATKRQVLKNISEIFDPLGLCTPVTFYGKVFMQKLWKRKLDWKDELPQDLLVTWNSIKKNLIEINGVKIDRYVGLCASDCSRVELHCFSDASEEAYAAAVYLVELCGGAASVNLLFSKSRVAPIKKVSIPRLELMGAVLGVRLLKFVGESLPFDPERVILWSDSKCILWWIHNTEKLMPVFIENRLKEIRNYRNVEFRYVPTSDNPADLPTRGVDAGDLSNSVLWWHGPSWLKCEESRWPENQLNVTVSEDVSAICIAEMPCSQLLVSSSDVLWSPFEIKLEKYSSLWKLLAVTAWSLRFTSCLKKKQSSTRKHLDTVEVSQARKMWESFIQQSCFQAEFQALKRGSKSQLINQLNLFIDGEGLLRCRGRLENAEMCFNAKYPKLLPGSSWFTTLVIIDIHNQAFHIGSNHTLTLVRCQYWIPCGRSVVQRVLRDCRICRRHEGGPYSVSPPPPLPQSRVFDGPPFSCTGLDHLGPLHLRRSDKGGDQQKMWICLFTCATIRAVHLELVQDMTAESVLLAIRRFVAVRGCPKLMISDNAKNFKLTASTTNSWHSVVADCTVQDYACQRNIQWKFIVEKAPWMGGFYERLVGSVKRSLRKSVRLSSCLSEVQLQTVIKEIEAVLNSRPLTYIESGIENNKVLTPAHFLFGNHKIVLSDLAADQDAVYKRCGEDSVEALLQRWKKGQRLLNGFWLTWREDYLLGLRERHIAVNQRGSVNVVPEIGHVVLMKDDLPRGQWKVGKISELLHSADNNVRAAIVSLPNGRSIKRPTRLLYPIEFSRECDVFMKNAEVEGRPSRIAKEESNRKTKDLLRRECCEEQED